MLIEAGELAKVADKPAWLAPACQSALSRCLLVSSNDQDARDLLMHSVADLCAKPAVPSYIVHGALGWLADAAAADGEVEFAEGLRTRGCVALHLQDPENVHGPP